jgi:hypothetical protein
MAASTASRGSNPLGRGTRMTLPRSETLGPIHFRALLALPPRRLPQFPPLCVQGC